MLKLCVFLVQEQGEAVWKMRDQLKAQLSTAELRQLLEANSQAIPSGESRVSAHIHTYTLYSMGLSFSC